MRKLSLLILIALLVNVGQSQEFASKKANNLKFDVSSGIITDQTITVEGETFDLFQTAKGAIYLKAISKAGNVYPVWIGTKTESLFEGLTVYVSKNNNYCVYKLGKGGYPYAKWLDKL